MAHKKEDEIEKNKRKTPWILGALVVGLLLFLSMMQSSNLWKNVSVDSTSETLLLYAFSSLNFLAFVVFALILARSLVKLRQERRALQLGSKLKTKLLIYFAAISLLPLIAMAVFSYLFMNRALERWFTQIPENVVRQAGELQSDTVENQKNKVDEASRMIARLLRDTEVDDKALFELRETGNLTLIQIIDSDKKPTFSSRTPVGPKDAQELKVVEDLIANGDFDNPLLSDGIAFDATVADLKEGSKLVIVPTAGPTGDVGQLMDASLRDFDRLKAGYRSVRLIGMSTLGLLTFLLIFASSWAAFYVAKGLTRPIRALAEGADEIARGNFSHRVEVFAEDELDLLVQAFNTMTQKLEENSVELEERRRYTETVLGSLSTGVISFDSEIRVTTINKAAISILRLEDADFIGFELSQLVREKNRVVFEKLIARALRVGQATDQSILFREDIDGGSSSTDDLTVALASTRLPDSSGAVIVIEDLSELILAQRASAWQEVARRMAHEIKNPLTPIQLSAERISKRFQDSGGDDPDIQKSGEKAQIVYEGTETILREVASLKSMVDEFSRFARLPDADKQEVSLKEVVETTIALYEGRENSVDIILNYANDIPWINADGEQLKRVFVNLIDNAIESFSEVRGENQIVISAVFEKSRELVRIEVADNGAGIDPADIPRLFQPYFSTKGRGTGLGLAIVSRIVMEHGGRISAAQNRPSGSKFSVELPI